jgi:predicted neuraminidase
MHKHFVTKDTAGQCHASTVCRTGAGFVVAWFQGDHEGAPNSQVWLTAGDGRSWAPPRVVSSDLGPCWNPVLHRQESSRLLLYFKVGAAISTWSTYVIDSTDEGLTWSPPRQLVAGDSGGRGPVRTSPIRLSSGRVLAGASTERWGERPRWEVFVDVSEDDGETWHRTPDIALDREACTGAGIIQPTLWQGRDGTVRMLARSTCGYLVASSSVDGGLSWIPGRPSSVPNNNSGISACAADRAVFLAHNPVSGDWAPRAPLVISVSEDDGDTWVPWQTLEERLEPDAEEGYAPADSGVTTTGRNEFSYPSLIATPDGLVVTYTWQRRGIVLALLDPSQRSAS